MAVEKAQAAAPVTFASMMEMMDLEAHSDLLLRAHFANQKTPPKGALPYTSLALFKAKPGKAPELAKAIERFFRPALDPLVESGDLFSYGLFEESEHSDPGMLYFVATVPSMASLDKLNAAFASAAGLQSSSTSIRETMLELSEPSEHRDYIMRAHAFAVR
jgi:hypothetical protein